VLKYFLNRSPFFVCFLLASASLNAQKILPEISVNNLNNNIVISWKNEYKVPVTNISIQRSYDSLKNYTTIGSVLSPTSYENGYSDNNPPYNMMYYRVFIAFEGGSYLITKSARPTKQVTVDSVAEQRYPWQANPFADSAIQIPPTAPTLPNINNPPIITKVEPAYPSKRIFTSKLSSVVIHLPFASATNYVVKFYDESDNKIFELTKLKDEYLILDKMNFRHSGWYHFEIYNNNELVEKNKFFIPKDTKTGNR